MALLSVLTVSAQSSLRSAGNIDVGGGTNQKHSTRGSKINVILTSASFVLIQPSSSVSSLLGFFLGGGEWGGGTFIEFPL